MSDKQDTRDEADKEQLLVDLATSKGERRRVIAVDFDGTCVTHEYPGIGKDIGAVPVLHKLYKAGNDLILFTIRDGKELSDACSWMFDNGIIVWGINENPEQFGWNTSRKVYANLYIDDAAAGCPLIWCPKRSDRPFVDWIMMDSWLGMHGWYAPLRTSRAGTACPGLREDCWMPKIPGVPENQDMLDNAAKYCICSNPKCGHHVTFGALFCSDKCRDAYYELKKEPQDG